MALAIRPSPRTGESLGSHIHRLARLNLLRPLDLGWPFCDERLPHADVDWSTLSETTGLSAIELRELTVFRYPTFVVGRHKRCTRATRWRATDLRRVCPTCPTDLHRRDWDLSLTTCCLECRQLLRPRHTPAAYPRIPVDDPLLTVQEQIAQVLAMPDLRRIQRRLSRLYRIVRLTSLTADARWPPTRSPYLEDLRTAPSREWAPWTPTRAPADPVVVAVLLTVAWHAAGRVAEVGLIQQAWRRLELAGIDLSPAQRRSLPRPAKPRPARKQRVEHSTISMTSLLSIRVPPTAISDAVAPLAAGGVTAQHIPLLLCPANQFLPPLHEIARRVQIAIQLCDALDPEAPAMDAAAYRIRTDTSTAEPTREELEPYLDALLAQEPVNYEHRRQDLTSLPQTIAPPARSLGGLAREQWPLAAAWIWVHHTRSPLLRDQHRVKQLDLVAFDRALTVEQRLALHQVAEDHLAWIADLRRTEDSTGIRTPTNPIRIFKEQEIS